MSAKIALAGTIRAIRAKRWISYEDLADVSVKASISALERGETNVSLEKLMQLAEGLNFDPVTLLAICVSIQRGEDLAETLRRASDEADRFLAEGGAELIEAQFVEGDLVQRARGKPSRSRHAEDIQTLKSTGLTRQQVAAKLGIGIATVYRHW